MPALDNTYRINEEQRNAKRKFNSDVQANRKRIVSGNYTWITFNRADGPTQLEQGHGLTSLNGEPVGRSWKSPIGYESVGVYPAGFNPDLYEGVLGGELCCDDNEEGCTQSNLFQILRNKVTGETEFLVLIDGEWQPRNPYADYWVPNPNYNSADPNSTPNIPATNPTDKYDFRGEKFDYALYKNTLYIVSGEEDFTGSHGASGLMKYDCGRWNSILTGNCGFIKNPQQYENTAAINPATGEPYDPNYALYDSPGEFNPSLLTVYQERLLISGAECNPLQVKVSEWYNPDNFVDNALGLQIAPLTTADSARPSSFVVTEGCDGITSLNNFNNSVYVGSQNSMYIYNLVRQDLGGGVSFELDSITENNYTTAGPVNQYSTVPFQNSLYYVSDSLAAPEFASFNLTSSTSGGNPASVYQRNSSDIEEFLKGLDFECAAAGVLGGKVLVSARCKDSSEEGNNIMIVGTPYSQDGTVKYSYHVLDYVPARQIFQNRQGTYFVSHEDGRMYRFTDNYSGIQKVVYEDGANVVKEFYPAATWQSGWTGFNPQDDRSFTKKKLIRAYVAGYFSEDSEVFLSFTPQTSCAPCGTCDETKTIKIDIEGSPSKDQCECECNLIATPKVKNGTNYRVIPIVFPAGEEFIYNMFSFRLDILNSRYFEVEYLSFLAVELENDASNIECVKFVDVDLGC